MTKWFVILSAEHERIRKYPLREKRIAAVALLPRNDKGTDCRSRLHGFAMTKWFVILSAEHERIRKYPLREKRIAAAVYTASQWLNGLSFWTRSVKESANTL